MQADVVGRSREKLLRRVARRPEHCYKATMEHLVQPTLGFIAAHASWAAVVMFITAFG